MKPPLVSILIPAYNAKEWIAYTLQSAIAQTWPRKEIIVVDDGSTDRTAEVARQFASKGIAVVSTENRGLSAAVNRAYRLCQGDYIQELDADDLLVPDKIERQLAALREGDSRRILLSCPWAPFFYRTRHARFVSTPLCQDLSPAEWLLRKMGENLHMQNATWLVSRELAEAAGPWDERLQYDQDGEYFARIVLASEGTRFVPETGIFYRVSPTSRVSYIGDSNLKKNSLFRSLKLHIQYLRSLEDSERVRKACMTYLQNWYGAFYPERRDIVAELEALALQFGGRLRPPSLQRRYSWMEPVFGRERRNRPGDWFLTSRCQALGELIRQCTSSRRAEGLLPLVRVNKVDDRPDAQPGQAMGQDSGEDYQHPERLLNLAPSRTAPAIAVALLTGGADEPYAFGLATALLAKGATMDLIGNDDLDRPEFQGKAGVNFLNLRGDQQPDASFARKVCRVAVYYARLIRYASRAEPEIFHILWNNRFEFFDRTLLMLYYKWLGKSIVLTAHNVNAGRRDFNDTRFNRFTLRVQYRLADHIFVHTEKMRNELREEFDIRERQITVIPFGINNAVPNTQLTPVDARRQLGICDGEKAILFFGRIAPSKGLEYLVIAFQQLLARHGDYRLIIAGRPNNCEKYWRGIQEAMREEMQRGRILLKAHFIPDDETEVYFKAADVLVLPYRHIYQSGVLFLAYSFGLPVLAADVGSLKNEIAAGKSGFVFRPEDPIDLATAIERYFTSDLHADLNNRRQEIRDYATQRHSWDVVGQMTIAEYASLLRRPFHAESLNSDVSSASLDRKTPS